MKLKCDKVKSILLSLSKKKQNQLVKRSAQLVLATTVDGNHFSNGKKKRENYKTKFKGATGIEPLTSRSEVEYSTTELYPTIG